MRSLFWVLGLTQVIHIGIGFQPQDTERERLMEDVVLWGLRMDQSYML